MDGFINDEETAQGDVGLIIDRVAYQITPMLAFAQHLGSRSSPIAKVR